MEELPHDGGIREVAVAARWKAHASATAPASLRPE
jgi:hypothetical protein